MITKYFNKNINIRLWPNIFHPRYKILILLREELIKIERSNFFKPGDIALDYGCGDKPYEPIFSHNFNRYIGVDLSRDKKADIKIDPESQLPIKDGCIDCVMSFQVLEHVKNPQFYLSEANRVLKKTGKIIISTHGMWQYHPDPVDYWRWTVEGLKLEIHNAGFEIQLIKYILCEASFALLLLQDKIVSIIPRFIRPLFYLFFQFCIGIIEKLRRNNSNKNSSIYIVLAKKSRNKLYKN